MEEQHFFGSGTMAGIGKFVQTLATQAAPAGGQAPADRLAGGVVLIALLCLLAAGMLLFLLAWSMNRKRRRLAELQADTKRRLEKARSELGAGGVKKDDAWTEAGRRAATPEAEDLEGQ